MMSRAWMRQLEKPKYYTVMIGNFNAKVGIFGLEMGNKRGDNLVKWAKERAKS